MELEAWSYCRRLWMDHADHWWTYITALCLSRDRGVIIFCAL